MTAKVIDDIAGARDAMVYGGAKIKAVVDGPATGPDSEVETASGPVKTLARLQAEYGVGARPGYATATTVDGQVLISSGPMVSPIGRLKRVADDGTGYFKCQSVKKHGLATGNLVVVSADGWHGVTHREHPVNSPWSYNEETEEAEVGSWEIEVIDPYWFKVPVAFVANSVFEQGQFWKADAVLIDAAPIYADLKDRVSDAGGGTIQLPAGHLWAEGPFHALEGVNVRGAGKNATFLVQGDRNDVHFWSHTGEGGFSFSDATLCCRRHRQDLTKGLHGWRIGSGTTIARNIEIRCRIEGSPGYGCGFQSDGAFTDCVIEIEGNMSDSDFVDGKNRSEEEENQRNRISVKFKHHGLWKIGTNFAPFELPTDAFYTTTGSSIVTVSHPGNGFSPEIVVTFPNGPTGNGVNLEGSWTIKGKVTNGYTIDISPQVATSTGWFGGAGKLEQAAQWSKGDAGVDLRGEGWVVGVIEGEGDGRGRTMVRHRNIKASGYNAGSSFGDSGSIKVKNTGPSRLNAIGVTIGGKGVNLPSVIGSGFAQLLNFQSVSQGNSVGLAQAIDCNVAGAMRGKDNSIGTLKAWECGIGFGAYGGTTTDIDYLEDDAFYAEEGSNVVVITREEPHGRTTGDLGTINNSQPGYGVDPDGVNQSITVIDDYSFSIVVSSNATGTGAFGGENATISWGTVQTNQNGTCGILQTIGCGVGAHIYEGAVGVQIGSRSSNGDTLSLIDAGTGTILYPASTVDPDTYKHASAAFTAGGVITDAELGPIDTFVKAEKAAEVWDLMLDYRLYGAVADSIASRVSLKRRVTANLIGTPTFTAYRGWKGDGVSAAINTGLTLSSQGGSLFTGGNGRQFVAMQDNVAGTMSAAGVSSGGSTRIRPRTASDTVSAQMMCGLTAFAETVTTSAGYTAVQRSGTAYMKGQRGSTIFAEVAVTGASTTLPGAAIYNLARNSDGVNEPHSGTIFASGVGAPLDDTKALAQAANVAALMVAVGAA